MTFRIQLILTAGLSCVFLAWFLPLRYGRTPETKERQRQQFHRWITGSSASVKAFRIFIALLMLATIAHVILMILKLE